MRPGFFRVWFARAINRGAQRRGCIAALRLGEGKRARGAMPMNHGSAMYKSKASDSGAGHTQRINPPRSASRACSMARAPHSYTHVRWGGRRCKKCGCKQRGARRGAWGAAEKNVGCLRRSEQEPDGGLVVALAPVLLGRVCWSLLAST